MSVKYTDKPLLKKKRTIISKGILSRKTRYMNENNKKIQALN